MFNCTALYFSFSAPFFPIQLVLCLLCVFSLEKFTLSLRERLWRAKSVVDFKGKTACRDVLLACSFPILTWKQKFVLLGAEQLGERLGSCWGLLEWPNIQQLIGSQVWWELLAVLFAVAKMLRILGLHCWNGENIPVLNYHIDEICLVENEDSRAARSRERERML